MTKLDPHEFIRYTREMRDIALDRPLILRCYLEDTLKRVDVEWLVDRYCIFTYGNPNSIKPTSYYETKRTDALWRFLKASMKDAANRKPRKQEIEHLKGLVQ